MRIASLVLSCCLCCAAALSGCGGEEPAASRSAMVFAAASLTGAFQALDEAFRLRHPDARLDLHFAGTSQLVVQVREGAPVDVFASADVPNMEKIEATGLVVAPPRVFARNRLTIVTAKGNPHGIRSLADLARPELRVVLCGPEVPAGRYAREAMAKASVTPRSLSDEPSVKAVVAKVRLGEVDAGVVYVTDATAAADHVDAVPLPDENDVVAAYPIAVLRAGRNRSLGEQFVAFVLSPDGQAVLRSSGFAGP